MTGTISGTNGSENPTPSAMDVDALVPTSGSASNNQEPPVSHPLTRRAASVPLRTRSFHVGYVYDDQMMLHSSSQNHPEAPARIAKVNELFMKNGLVVNMKRILTRSAKREEVMLVHSEQIWEDVSKLARKYSSIRQKSLLS